MISLSAAISGLMSFRATSSPVFSSKTLIDSPHPALPQLLDDLEPAGEYGSPGELLDGRPEGFGDKRLRVFDRWEKCPALPAELLGLGIIVMTFRAVDGHR